MKKYELTINLRDNEIFVLHCTQSTIDYVCSESSRGESCKFLRFDKGPGCGFLVCKSEIVAFNWREVESCGQCEETPQGKQTQPDSIKSFLEGLKPVHEQLNFSQVVEGLKNGKKFRRRSWHNATYFMQLGEEDEDGDHPIMCEDEEFSGLSLEDLTATDWVEWNGK